MYRQGPQGNTTLGELPESCSMYGKDFGILDSELWKREVGVLELMDMGRCSLGTVDEDTLTRLTGEGMMKKKPTNFLDSRQDGKRPDTT